MYTAQPGLSDLMRPHADPARNATRLMLGRVVGVHDETDQIDVALIGGGRIDHVPIVAPAAGRSYGVAGLPTVTAGYGTAAASGKHDTYALIAYLKGEAEMPICLGFIGPKDSDLLKRPAGATIRRESGGQVRLSYADGAEEWRFAAGASIRVGSSATLATLDASLLPPENDNDATIALMAPGGILINGNQLTIGVSLVVSGGTANQLAIWTATNTLGGNSGLTFDQTTKTMTLRRDVSGAIGPSLILSNGAGSAGAGAAIDMNGFIGGTDPQVRLRSMDDGYSSAHFTIWTKTPGSSGYAALERVRVASAGALLVGKTSGFTATGDLDANGAIRGATIQDATNNLPWKLGGYTVTAPAATGYVTVNINGTNYKLLAST